MITKTTIKSLRNDDSQNKQDEQDLYKDQHKSLEGVGLQQEDDDLEGTIWVAAVEECGSVWLGSVTPVPWDVSPYL